MKLAVKAAIILSVLACLSPPLGAEIKRGDWAVGINYPGLSGKYFFSDNFSLEVRGQKGDNIFTGGLRGNLYFNPAYKTVLFSGVEADYLAFKGEESKGTGLAGEVFFGLEYFFLDNFSFQADLGPAYIHLKDNDSALTVSGIEYVVNFGFNWYPGKGNKREKEEWDQ
jgi:hypothetical protein